MGQGPAWQTRRTNPIPQPGGRLVAGRNFGTWAPTADPNILCVDVLDGFAIDVYVAAYRGHNQSAGRSALAPDLLVPSRMRKTIRLGPLDLPHPT